MAKLIHIQDDPPVCLFEIGYTQRFFITFPTQLAILGVYKKLDGTISRKIFYSYVPMIFPYCPIKSFHNIHVTWLLLQSDHFPIIPILFRHIMVPLKPYYGSIYNGCFSSHIFSHPAGLV